MLKLKNDNDIEGIRRSCALLGKTFEYMESIIKIGMTGLSLNKKVEEYIYDHNGVPAFKNYDGFPSGLCISANDKVIHGIPDSKVFEDGDLVSLDCGINLAGYISDSAYTFPLGNVRPELLKLCKVAEESLYLGIENALPGNRIHDISRAVFKHNKKDGFGIVRSYCGHGVGFEVHEDPQVPNYVSSGPNPRLKPGMVIAIEPMVNLGGDDVYIDKDGWTVYTRDHSPSVHFEHTVAITEKGVEILTLWGAQKDAHERFIAV